MLKSYIKIAFRNLLKNKVFSLLNIAGLSVAVAFVLAIGIYIYNEWKVNANIQNRDNVYMLQSKWKESGMGLDWTTLAPLPQTLKENYPNLVQSYYHHDAISSVIIRNNNSFREQLQPGDPNFLDMFGFPLAYGNAANALESPFSLVITEAKAKKYFGKTDVINQTLTILNFSGEKQDFTITGVLKDLPYNTINSYGGGTCEFFLPTSSLRFFGKDTLFTRWSNAFIPGYVQLKEGKTPADLQEPIKQILRTHAPNNFLGKLEVYLTPLRKYYLESNNGVAARMINVLAGIVLFILLMAAINFINISIGSSVSRLREIGVRKVMGGTKTQLVKQFLTESTVLAAIASVIALIIYFFATDFFSDILGKKLPGLFSYPIGLLLIVICFNIFVIGAIAGIYPAFVLARQALLSSLKGKLQSVHEKIAFRRSLITMQFIIAIVVLIVSIVVNRQVNYFFNKDLGYDKEQLISMSLPRDWTPQGVRHMEVVRNEFSTLPEIAQASFSFEIPDGRTGQFGSVIYKASSDSTTGVVSQGITSDEYYAATYGLTLSGGDFFTAQKGVIDSASMVINESAAKALGWREPANAIGMQLKKQSDPVTYIVRGVIKDFHFGSMHSNIQPLFFIHVRNRLFYRYLTLKVRPGNMAQTLNAVRNKWAKVLPDAPFEYTFMDETLGKLYRAEVQMKRASDAASVIALMIVLLGILGIVLLSIAKRTKEVAVRKLLGASIFQISFLFFKEFLWSIALSNVIGWPIAWFLLKKWLDNYAYKVSIQSAPFILVGIVLFSLIGFTILLLTKKIALSNTIKNLKTE